MKNWGNFNNIIKCKDCKNDINIWEKEAKLKINKN